MRIAGNTRRNLPSFYQFSLTFVVFAAIWIGLSRPAMAFCEHPPTKWAFGQQFSQTWITDGEVCKSISNFPENIDEIRITEKAKHGISGKNGRYGVAYKPNPGFKGTDSFTYEVISNANYRKGPGMVATVMITVIVQ
jgi:hypothetical protein